MSELKDIGLTRNSDLAELGVDEFEHLSKKPKKEEEQAETEDAPKKRGRPKKSE